jgi:hypothetical protein
MASPQLQGPSQKADHADVKRTLDVVFAMFRCHPFPSSQRAYATHDDTIGRPCNRLNIALGTLDGEPSHLALSIVCLTALSASYIRAENQRQQ